jgi:ABC-2 type transport system permease protein
MNARKTYWQRHTLEILFIIAIFVLLGFVSDRFYTRADLTKDKAYTLTPATKKILHNIKGIVNAKFYLSRDLSADVMPAAEQIKDVLSEYEAFGGGSFRMQIIDPTNNDEVKNRAKEIGIPEVQVQVMQRDQLAVKKVFLGIALTYRDKSETIPVVSDPNNLEYELTSRIFKLTREKTPVLGIVDFSRNYDFNNPQGSGQSRFNALKQALGERFEVKDVKLEEELEIPGDVQAVIILQPLGLSEQAKYVLDQFLLRGGNIFAPTDALMISQQQMQGFPGLPGYETAFKNYGLELKKMLVLDKSSEMAQFSGGAMVIQMQYPEWVKIVPPNGFSPDFGPTALLSKLVLPWSGYLSVGEKLSEGLKATAIITTSQDAWAVNSPFNLNPQQDWRAQYANSPKKGRFALGYLLSGTFPSAFSAPPKPEDTAAADRLALIAAKLDPAKYIAKSEKPGNLVIVSNGSFLEDNFIQRFPDNLLFAQNVADWMLSSGELIGIRSRNTEARPFKKELTEPVKNLIKYSITAGIPLLVILLGLLRYGMRLRKRQAVRARYQPPAQPAPPTPPTTTAEG